MKDLLLGLLIGGIVGLWFGVNLGKNQPLLSNPFAQRSSLTEFNKKFKELQKDVSDKSEELYNDSKKAVDDVF